MEPYGTDTERSMKEVKFVTLLVVRSGELHCLARKQDDPSARLALMRLSTEFAKFSNKVNDGRNLERPSAVNV